jgi:hypothetical protein
LKSEIDKELPHGIPDEPNVLTFHRERNGIGMGVRAERVTI